MRAQLQQDRESLFQKESSPNKNSRSSQRVELYRIATQMKEAGLPDSFIDNATQMAQQFEGTEELMHLWDEEKDPQERNEIIADIQDVIDAASQKEFIVKYIKFSDLDEIAKNIRVFKDSLYQTVIEFGGVTKLSELTGIPQPSTLFVSFF